MMLKCRQAPPGRVIQPFVKEREKSILIEELLMSQRVEL